MSGKKPRLRGKNWLRLKGKIMALDVQGTDYLKMPVGTTGQRPAVPASGMVRMNSTTSNPEWWDATTSSWLQFSQPAGYLVNYLIVAGGGSGGKYYGGGGGAGGLLNASTSLSSGTSYTITVGAGGASVTVSGNGLIGNNSSINTVATALGGGFGAGSASLTNGGNGGSGGGGTSGGNGGSGTSGQGFAGGVSSTAGGGGGGASAVGGTSTGSTIGGNGGNGFSSSISGSAITYAGGGGGSGTTTGGTGGTGGGGAGSNNATANGISATANTGGGGGGASGDGISGTGGSGIVIISYLGAQRGTGGTVTSSGGYTIHTFTSSSTYNA